MNAGPVGLDGVARSPGSRSSAGVPSWSSPIMLRYSTNAKGNFQFDRVISGWRDRPVVDLRLKQ